MDKIKDSIFKFLRIDNLMDNLSGYVETRAELLKIEIREEVVKIISKGIVIGLVALFSLLLLFFLSMGLAQYLNSVFDNVHSGYWIVAGIYAIPCIIFLAFRKSIGKNFEKKLLESIKHKEK